QTRLHLQRHPGHSSHRDLATRPHQRAIRHCLAAGVSAWPDNTWGGTQHLAAADFDGDGKTDLLRIAANNLYRYNGNSNGSFAPFVMLGSSNWAYVDELTVGDYNRDGAADLVVELDTGGLRLFGGRGGSFPSDLTEPLWPNTGWNMRHIA
ncbi:VCBS repeat-containing protein, partial [Streptomyces sp. NPDC005963]|uniref:FG-GAP repeat domain-containing protein n=1 Tax=Streptomyces sp. NPDC005963 TaxID=3156721 RepID=UPI0033E0D890